VFFGIANFSLEGVAMVMPIRGKMKQPRNFNKYLIWVTVGDVIFSVLLSNMAYFVKNYFAKNRNLGIL
jgi:hypothetical protein